VAGVALNGEGTVASNAITFTVQAPGVEVSQAIASLVRGRTPPSLSISVTSASGAGAGLAPVFIQGFSRLDQSPVWDLNDFAINAAGSGYARGDQLVFTLTNGVEHHGNFFTPWIVKTVGPGGSIVDFELDTDDKDLIEFWFREYYGEGGPIESIQVTSAGAYYLPGPTTIEVATVTVTVAQRGRAAGTYGGASISATINNNPDSATFGQITALNIANGGFGYLAWEWVEVCCGPYWNGKSVVLRRPNRTSGGFGPLDPCLYQHRFLNKGCIATVEVQYSTSAARVMVWDRGTGTDLNKGSDAPYSSANGTCFAEAFRTPGQNEECVPLPFEATAPSGVTLTVTPGGNYAPLAELTGSQTRHVCCRDGGTAPLEIEATVYPASSWTGEGWVEPDPYSIVLVRGLNGGPSGAVQNCTISYGGFGFYAAVTHCNDYYTAGCQSCAKQCQTRAGCPGDDYINFPNDHHFSPGCIGCSGSTMCRPQPGTYVISNNRNGLLPQYPLGLEFLPPPPNPYIRLEIPE
jgi:hypothetical protein